MKKKLHPATRILLHEINVFLHRTGMTQTAFGIAAMNDGNFIARLHAGRTPKLETFDRVRRYMEQPRGR